VRLALHLQLRWWHLKVSVQGLVVEAAAVVEAVAAITSLSASVALAV
jgi:hypothetical protein